MTLLFSILTYQGLHAQQILDLFTTQTLNSRFASEEILKRYLEPSLIGIAKNNNSGWYHSGKVHPGFSFDIYFNVNLVRAKDEYLAFSIDDIKGVDISPTSAANKLPTILGEDDTSIPLVFEGENLAQNILAVDGYEFVGIPYGDVHFGLGIGSSTEIIGRFLPKINYRDFSIKTWGVGLKHGIIQWFYDEKQKPFDLTLFGSYTVSEYELRLKQPTNPEYHVKDPGHIKFGTRGATVEGLLSKRFEMFYLYLGAGYNFYESDARFSGDYSMNNSAVEELNFNKDLRYFLDGANWKYTAGLKLTIGLIFINGDYTYNFDDHIFTGGIGLAIR